MKCPKCHYLSFDPEPRCRNCGHTLSLDEDLAINPNVGGAAPPLVDLALRGEDAPWSSPAAPTAPSARRTPAPTPPVRGPRERTTSPGPFDEMIDAKVADPGPLTGHDRTAEGAAPLSPPGTEVRGGRRHAAPATTELPLFVKGMTPDADSEREHTDMASPDALLEFREERSAPVAVRRSSTDSPSRTRGEAPASRLGPLDRDLLEGLQRIEQAEQRNAVAAARRLHSEDAAGAGRRMGAAAIDMTLLGSLGVGVVWLTLRILDMTWAQVGLLPPAPIVAFVLLIALGYLFMFTAASGQTAGKMLAGIRVVDAALPGASPVTAAQALYREALTIPSVLLLGAGFVPGLVGDQRALHDRLSQTRVVRA